MLELANRIILELRIVIYNGHVPKATEKNSSLTSYDYFVEPY